MRTSTAQRYLPILGAVILLAVLVAGCTQSPGPQPAATPATTAPSPEATVLATTVSATAPAPQVTATILNQSTVDVTIKAFTFSPQFVTVSKGTTVIWTNQDPTPHQVINDPAGFIAGGMLFRSGPLTTGQSYSFTFNTTGDFKYHCNIHPAMEGKVIVV